MKNTANVPSTKKIPLLLALDYASILPIVTFVGSYWVFAPEKGVSLRGLILPLTLLVGGWLPFWYATLSTNWHSALQTWRTWQSRKVLVPWPYLQTNTPGATLHRRLEQGVDWWLNTGRQTLAAPLCKAGLALSVSILLGIFLGRQNLMLSLLYIAWTELAVLWNSGKGYGSSGWRAVAIVGLPWLLGGVISEGDILYPLLSALALSFTIGLLMHPSLFTLMGLLIGTGYLAWQQYPLAAGCMLLFTLPELHKAHLEQSTQRNHISLWIVAVVCVFIGAL